MKRCYSFPINSEPFFPLFFLLSKKFISSCSRLGHQPRVVYRNHPNNGYSLCKPPHSAVPSFIVHFQLFAWNALHSQQSGTSRCLILPSFLWLQQVLGALGQSWRCSAPPQIPQILSPSSSLVLCTWVAPRVSSKGYWEPGTGEEFESVLCQRDLRLHLWDSRALWKPEARQNNCWYRNIWAAQARIR